MNTPGIEVLPHRATLPCRCLAILVMLLCTCFSVRAEKEGPAARLDLNKEVNAKLLEGDWPWLEKTGDELRKTKARFREGLWKLHEFYAGITPQTKAQDEKEWAECFRKLDEWKAAFPKSITQMVARAHVTNAYGWKARTSEWAKDVTPQGWKDLRDRQRQARAVLLEAEQLPEKCPEWFCEMQIFALGHGADRAEYDKLCQRAVAFEPTYYNFYFNRARFLLDRWYGKEGEWLTDLDRAVREDVSGEGMTIYARTVWSLSGEVTNNFRQGGASWEKTRQGFRDIEKKYPDSKWNLNNFCRFALFAKDRDTAKELMQRIGDTPMLRVWENKREQFELVRKWALEEKK